MNNIEELAVALQKSLNKKNNIPYGEFSKYNDLFNKKSDKTTEAYAHLCSEWASRISLYHPVHVIDPTNNDNVLFTLPPFFNKVEVITNNPNSESVINRFEHADASNHPLRSDKEEALELFKHTIYTSQNRAHLVEAADRFEEIARAAGFEPEVDAEKDKQNLLGNLEWTTT